MQKGWGQAAVVLALLGTGPARSAEASDFYVSAGVGAAYTPNGSLEGPGGEVWFDLGRPVGSLALGMERDSGWRFELDGSYRFNDAEVVFFEDGSPDLQSDADSRISALSLALNAIHEWETQLGVRPYLGAGVGGARIDYEISEYFSGERMLDDEDRALVYQLVAGFGLEVTRRLDLLVDYRYWHAPDVGLQAVDGAAVETEYRIHSAMLNLRYRPFGSGRGAAPAGPKDATGRRGWYVHGRGGMSFAKDAEIEDNIANFDAFEVGPTWVVGLGRTLGERWRLELEGAHRSNEAEIVDFNPELGEDRADGTVRARSLMANLIYEPGWQTTFRPYVGLGAGVAWARWNVGLKPDDSTFVDDRDAAAALQVMFGAAAAVNERLAVTAEFRYWLTAPFDLEEPDGRPMRTELTVNSLMLGVRYAIP